MKTPLISSTKLPVVSSSLNPGRVALLLWLVGRSFVGVDRLISVRSEAACCCFVVSICFLGWRLGEDIMLLFWLFLSWAVPAVDYANILQPSFVHFSSFWFQLLLSLPPFFSFHFFLQSLFPADCQLLLPSLRRILSIIRVTFELLPAYCHLLLPSLR
uniref:Uncharacterized protein n=1 Tax=Salix viminalis TaxID=40686 RepID=A0A6N2NB14_SALVM